MLTLVDFNVTCHLCAIWGVYQRRQLNSRPMSGESDSKVKQNKLHEGPPSSKS